MVVVVIAKMVKIASHIARRSIMKSPTVFKEFVIKKIEMVRYVHF